MYDAVAVAKITIQPSQTHTTFSHLFSANRETDPVPIFAGPARPHRGEGGPAGRREGPRPRPHGRRLPRPARPGGALQAAPEPAQLTAFPPGTSHPALIPLPAPFHGQRGRAAARFEFPATDTPALAAAHALVAAE